MATDLVILVGPMSAAQLGAVAWQRPTKVVTINSGPAGYSDQDGTIGPGAFAAKWAEMGSVAAVAEQAGITDLGAVGLVAFSAGWAFAAPALAEAKVAGALLLDACFAPAAGFSTLVKNGYASYADRAARGNRLLVMTGGQGGRFHPGAACVWANVEHAASSWEAWEPPTSPSPVRAVKTGSLYAAEYPASVAHGAHVTVLGRPLANDLLAPWLAGGFPSTTSKSGLFAAVSGAALTALATYAFLRLPKVHTWALHKC